MFREDRLVVTGQEEYAGTQSVNVRPGSQFFGKRQLSQRVIELTVAHCNLSKRYVVIAPFFNGDQQRQVGLAAPAIEPSRVVGPADGAAKCHAIGIREIV
jgi:hypothetical protein